MSTPFVCKCPERKKPVADRNWIIEKYRRSYSAFNGYRYAPSDYSTVRCLECGARGRTKAKFVEELPQAKVEAAAQASFEAHHYHKKGGAK